MMFKQVAAGVAVLTIAVSLGAAHAEPGTEPAQASQPAPSEGSAQDRSAFLNARMAALHAVLLLTPEQERAWPNFEKAYRDLAELRGRHHFHARSGDAIDPVARAQHQADALAARSAALKNYAGALAPLYQTLDDGQKRRFAFLQRFGHHRFHHGFGREREFGDRGEFHRHGDDRDDRD